MGLFEICILSFNLIVALYLIISNLRRKNSVGYTIELNANTINEIDSMLENQINNTLSYVYDIVIEEYINEIQVNNPKIKEENIYINDKNKDEIVDDTFYKFMETNLSDDIKKKLETIYGSVDKMEEVIYMKFYYKITSYVMEYNKLIFENNSPNT